MTAEAKKRLLDYGHFPRTGDVFSKLKQQCAIGRQTWGEYIHIVPFHVCAVCTWVWGRTGDLGQSPGLGNSSKQFPYLLLAGSAIPRIPIR